MLTVETTKQFDGNEDQINEPVFEMGSLGSGLESKGRKVLNLTVEMATHFLELPEFAGDRPLNNGHVIFLTRQMKGGLFRWEQVSIITCKCMGREYRMNGQHTCWARLEIDKEVRIQNAPVQHFVYEAKTEQDMRQLYATIDRNKARSNGNVVVSYLAGREEFIQFKKNMLKILAEGLAFWRWEKDGQRALHVADERAFLMLTEHYDLTTKVGNFLNASKLSEARFMNRRPVVAAMFATFDKAPVIAEHFWSAIRDGNGMASKNDPRLKLRTYLMTSTIAAGGKANSREVDTVSSEEMFRTSIASWNAFREGHELKNFRIQLERARTAVRS